MCCGSLSVAYSVLSGRFVAVSSNANNTLAYSDDGKNWVGLGKSVFSGAGLYVLRVDELGLFVASGSEILTTKGLLGDKR
jgi:hypothetical protein